MKRILGKEECQQKAPFGIGKKLVSHSVAKPGTRVVAADSEEPQTRWRQLNHINTLAGKNVDTGYWGIKHKGHGAGGSINGFTLRVS